MAELTLHYGAFNGVDHQCRNHYSCPGKEIEGDGNCLFRAFLFALKENLTKEKYLTSESSPEFIKSLLNEDLEKTLDLVKHLRLLCARKYMENSEAYQQFLTEGEKEHYAGNLTRNGEWGGNIEIAILEDIFGVGVKVVASEDTSIVLKEPKQFSPEGGSSLEFDWVNEKDKDRDNILTPLKVFLESKVRKVDEILPKEVPNILGDLKSAIEGLDSDSTAGICGIPERLDRVNSTLVVLKENLQQAGKEHEQKDLLTEEDVKSAVACIDAMYKAIDMHSVLRSGAFSMPIRHMGEGATHHTEQALENLR